MNCISLLGFSGRGPTAKYMPTESYFYIVKHGKDTGVWSCEGAYTKKFWIYSGSRRHYIVFPCYHNLNDSNISKWWLIHRPIDNNGD